MASHFGQSLQVNGRHTGAELEERRGLVWEVALPVTVELGEDMGKSHSSKLIGRVTRRTREELDICRIMTYTLDFDDWTRNGAVCQATDWSRGEHRVEVFEKDEMIVCRISG